MNTTDPSKNTIPTATHCLGDPTYWEKASSLRRLLLGWEGEWGEGA